MRHQLLFAASLTLVTSALWSQAPPQDCAQEKASLFVGHGGEATTIVECTLYSGEDAELRLGAYLRANDACVQSYSISVAHPQEVIEIVGATFEETDSDFYFHGAFAVVEPTRTGDGFVAAVQAGGACPNDQGGGGSLFGPFPTTGDFSLVFAQYRVLPRTAPLGGELVVEGVVEYRDGLRGRAEPVSNYLFVDGSSVDSPCTQSLLLRITFLDTVEFIRGDANFDWKLDISDAVTILRASFFGDTKIRCNDAGDANDDSKIDISDAITIFNHLFLGKAPPPAPFPQAGADPTEDGLRCRP